MDFFYQSTLAVCLFCLVWIIIIIIAILRKPPKKKPQYIESFKSEYSPDNALKSITYYALHSGYEIEYFSEQEKRITLGDPFSFSRGSFFYPIYIGVDETGHTLVEVGVKGKISITGSAAFRFRDKVVNGIKALTFLYSK